MCGICGFTGPISKSSQAQPVVQQMSDILAHRGPDDCGYYLDEHTTLGHRRLSIVDLAGGHQPMANEDESIWITFNGEIYNHASYRPILEAKGHVFKTRSDTETILHLYEEYGEDCPKYLNGIFAFAIWDLRQQKLFLARDHLGVKFLYYALIEGNFIFASEIKSLRQFPGFQTQLNLPAVADYFAFQHVWGEDTFFQGVKVLEPGHYLSYSKGQVRTGQYWDVRYSKRAEMAGVDEQQAIGELRDLIEDAVRLQLMSDVPLGSYLSGGIDSSILVTFASQHYQAQLQSFSATFPESPEHDESYYVALMSKKFNTAHHNIYPTSQDFVKAFPQMVWYLDQPVLGAGMFPQYYVSKLAVESVKVCLGGQGGDEIFSGYARHFFADPITNVRYLLQDRLIKHSNGTNKALPANMRKQINTETMGWMLQNFFRMLSPLPQRYYNQFHVLKDSLARSLLTPDFYDQLAQYHPFSKVVDYMDRSGTDDPLGRVTYLETKTYLTGLLALEDRMSMAWSLESRVPLLDYRILEFAAKLPPHLKLRGMTTKYIIKRVAQTALPPEILARKKQGFPVPTARWFETDLKEWVSEILLDPRTLNRGYFQPDALRDIIAHKQGRFDRYWERIIWQLLHFEVWHRLFIDNQSSQDF